MTLKDCATVLRERWLLGTLVDEVHVYHVGLMGDQPGGMAQAVNQYLRWKTDSTRIFGILTTRRRRDPLSPLLSAIALLRIIRVASARSRRSVVVFHISDRGAFLREGGLLLVASRLGLPCIAHLHSGYFEQFAQRRPRLVRFVLSRAVKILALTKAASHAVETLGIATPVSIVPNAVEVPATVDWTAKTPTVIYCAEVSLLKGADVLFQAWRCIEAEYPDWKLMVVGPDRGEVEPPRSRSIVITGSLPHDQALRLQRDASIAVLPSRKEALPMFLLEAMGNGCVPVGTHVGFVTDLITPDVGRLVPPGDVEALARELRDLMGYEDLRPMGEAAHARIDANYSTASAKPVLVGHWRNVALDVGQNLPERGDKPLRMNS